METAATTRPSSGILAGCVLDCCPLSNISNLRGPVRKKGWSLILWFLIVILACPVARATVLQRLYLDDMAEESVVIVHGTVLSSRAEWNASRSSIWTVYTMRAHRYLKGFLGETLEFREPGGTVGNVGMFVAGAPEFRTDEEVLLFLWTDGRSRRYQCIGLEQGALRVRQDGVVKLVNRSIPVRLEEATQAGSPRRSRLAPISGTSRELETLLAEVATALAQAEAAAAGKEAR